MIDLIIHAGTKLALEQWLAARGLGTLTQDTNPASPTFGQYFYGHTAPGMWHWWRHPDGKVMKTAPVYSGQTLVTPAVMFTGYFGMLNFPGPAIPIEDWIRNNTAVSVLDTFTGYGGEGITILNPDDISAHLISIGQPDHTMVNGVRWSDPNMWWLGPVMVGTEREYEGQIWRSLIPFNVYNPSQYPAGWELVGDIPPQVEAWVQPQGAHDSYQIGDKVLFNGSVYESLINGNSWSPAVYPAGWRLVP